MLKNVIQCQGAEPLSSQGMFLTLVVRLIGPLRLTYMTRNYNARILEFERSTLSRVRVVERSSGARVRVLERSRGHALMHACLVY